MPYQALPLSGLQQFRTERREHVQHRAALTAGGDEAGPAQHRGVLAGRGERDAHPAGQFGGGAPVRDTLQYRRPVPAYQRGQRRSARSRGVPTGARCARPRPAGSAAASRPRGSGSRAGWAPCRRRPREPARCPGRPVPSPPCPAYRSPGPAAASGSAGPAARPAARRDRHRPASGGGRPARRASRRGCGARTAGPARGRRPGWPRPARAARRPRPSPTPAGTAGAAGRCTPSPPASARAAPSSSAWSPCSMVAVSPTSVGRSTPRQSGGINAVSGVIRGDTLTWPRHSLSRVARLLRAPEHAPPPAPSRPAVRAWG